MLGVLPEERLEGAEQLTQVQPAAGVDVPRHLLHETGLRRRGELPRHHLTVYRVGDAGRVVARDQPEVADVLQVVP